MKTTISKMEMIELRLKGYTYKYISDKAGVSRQRIQQVISPPTAVRDYIIKKYDGYCIGCGLYVGHSGHIHHEGADGGEDYNDMENLQLLCISCHRKKHCNKHRNNIFYCLHCGKPIDGKNKLFCDRECLNKYFITTLTCCYCDKTFPIKVSLAYWRTKRSKTGLIFCGKICQGRWLGENYNKGKRKPEQTNRYKVF